jgi:hypothetical protein
MRTAIIITAAAALLLAGCATPTGPVEVTRFNRAAEGQSYGKGSFTVAMADSAKSGELALSPYLAAVRQEMQRAGYTDDTNKGQIVAEVGVYSETLAPGTSRSPVSVGVGGQTGGGYRSGVGVGVGLDITNLINKPKPRVATTLSVRLLNRSDQSVIWEGKASQEASAGTPAAQPGIAAAKLASALFSGFPGKSGETISVK